VIVLFGKVFTSSSKLIERAKHYIKTDEIKGTVRGFLFTIKSRSGRSLRELSCYPAEEEIVFRPNTSFKILTIEIKEMIRQKNLYLNNEIEIVPEVYHVTVVEEHPDIRGRKVLVWIDDRVSEEEFHSILDDCEKDGVTCVHVHSTKEAKEFFTKHHILLKCNIRELRIITDMVRSEEEGVCHSAGIHLACMLREQFNYSQPILCFCGQSHLKQNRSKFQQKNLFNVYATSDLGDAEGWARFRRIPDAVKEMELVES